MKRIIGIILIVVAAATGVWNFNQTQNEVELSDLALANVEALATPETDDEFTAATGCYATCCSSTCKQHQNASSSKCYCYACTHP